MNLHDYRAQVEARHRELLANKAAIEVELYRLEGEYRLLARIEAEATQVQSPSPEPAAPIEGSVVPGPVAPEQLTLIEGPADPDQVAPDQA